MPRPTSDSVAIRIVLGGYFLCFVAVSARSSEPVASNDRTASSADKVSFVRQVAPLLVKHCIACHGEKNPEGEYQLHSFARAMKEGASASPTIVAGKPQSSALYRLVASADPEERMPHQAEPLAKEQIALIGRWIEEGAAFDGADTSAALALIIPRQEYPEPPPTYSRAVPITALAFSPDGRYLTSSGYHEVLVWNMGPGATGFASVGGSTGVASGTRESTGTASGTPIEPYSLARRIKNVAQRTHTIAFSPDGTLLAVAAGTPGRVGEVKLFHPQTGELVAELTTTSDEMFDVEFSRDGSRLAACGADRTIRIFDVAERKEIQRIEAHADWVMAIAWSPDGTKLASAGRDKAAKLIDAATGTVLVTYPGHDEQVFDVLFSASGEQVFSAGRGREVHRWSVDGKSTSKSDVRKKETGGIFGRTRGDIHRLSLSGDHVLALSADGKLSEFDPDKNDIRDPAMVYEGAPPQAFALAMHEATKRLAIGGFDGRVAVYEAGDAAPWQVWVAAPRGNSGP